MNCAGDQFLSHTGLAKNQNRSVTAGDAASNSIHLLHRRRTSDDSRDGLAAVTGWWIAEDRHEVIIRCFRLRQNRVCVSVLMSDDNAYRSFAIPLLTLTTARQRYQTVGRQIQTRVSP